jgi:hypothetical protein
MIAEQISQNIGSIFAILGDAIAGIALVVVFLCGLYFVGKVLSKVTMKK